jgi:hypothetical protein
MSTQTHALRAMPVCGSQAITHGGIMKKSLPARPNLDHLSHTFIEHLPAREKDGAG